MSAESSERAPHTGTGASYASAGVDIEAGDRAVDLMKEWVKKATRPEVVGGLGGFAGLFDASALKRYERPLLASATDGVGTKVDIARKMGVYDSIGHDLVGMVVDDLVVCGAEPLFMTDYICVGKVYPERVAAIVKGIAEGCVLAGCALVGGETAEHPGLLGVDEFDVAGAGTGVVEADRVLGADRIRTGDAVIAMASSGLHSNGYSLVRHVLFDRAGMALDREIPEFGRTLGEELLEPTKIYSLDCLALTRTTEVHAFSHITGGGLANNLARVIPDGLHATVDRTTWTPGPVFDLVGSAGSVERGELEKTLNMGVGMIAVVPQGSVEAALTTLADRGVDAWVSGEIVERGDHTEAVTLTGDYAG
ncbi:phosphoribosylformylglycinamidine cyclo-ligase [Streptomyces platensis]|uniref:phosphoribosylformylglycinamidine cyclo-ligase n=1 Tax=Streptomyces platensis TaxID=58346 RepID=UPI002E0ECC3C|nr:phosphoribosylformylglycinamidine cyclo-ligase [Streptomyces platensis]WSI56846.1 phosphoribosylformylglycinamidine cyclo-ligase [Streptomyces platensis]WTI53107.1 phosphoribosylformylglycinamidine cyclo-ligase [Streptomyces platensis]WUB81278.1 phosphoribosylformylglycinamidine cyclo-ligase [Streptomyces platensis]